MKNFTDLKKSWKFKTYSSKEMAMSIIDYQQKRNSAKKKTSTSKHNDSHDETLKDSLNFSTINIDSIILESFMSNQGTPINLYETNVNSNNKEGKIPSFKKIDQLNSTNNKNENYPKIVSENYSLTIYDNEFNKQINNEEIKKIDLIYQQMEKRLNELNESQKKKRENIIHISLLAYEYVNFVLGNEFIKLIIQFKNDHGLNFLYFQLYLFLTILYLSEENDNFMPFITSLSYSYINFKQINNLINQDVQIDKFFFCNPNSKEFKNFVNNNSIIHWSLCIIEHLYPIHNNFNLKINNTTKDLISIVKELENNQNLKNKLDSFQKSIILPEDNYLIPAISKENKFKYTLIINLDDVLVFYCEEKESAFVKIRYWSEKLILSLSQYYEMILYTSDSKENAEIIVNGIDEKNLIFYVIYEDKLNEIKEIDLKQLGRDIKRTLFVNSFNSELNIHQKENVILIDKFSGDENDNQLELLEKLLLSVAMEGNIDIVTNVTKINSYFANGKAFNDFEKIS